MGWLGSELSSHSKENVNSKRAPFLNIQGYAEDCKMKNNVPLMKERTIGSVLVVGGGIAGLQASLDLANSGYLVHLVEKDPAIGGMMSALDKTFPTNDCAL
jgi:heterodisulfide reductase subunit A-like polyferredoxin